MAHIVEENIGVPIIGSSAPAFLFIGLAHDGEGQVHLGGMNHWHLRVYEQHADDLNEANRVIMQQVHAEMSEHAAELPNLLGAKSIWA